MAKGAGPELFQDTNAPNPGDLDCRLVARP